ncbi:hypothetical protein B0H19DRAFT_1090878 [Mycena capillaripes]|nr:hypothetical protein B0H19DRAFT_1090878 [Mycena capillaripes]
MNPDPYHLVPLQFRDDMYGPGFKSWLVARDTGIRLSNSSRVYGNSRTAYKNQVASHVRLSNDKPALSRGGIAGSQTLRAKKAEREQVHKMLEQCLLLLQDPFRWLPKQKSKTGNISTVDSPRYAVCAHCSEMVVAKDHNFQHNCGSGAMQKVTEGNFPSLQRFVFAQDIFRLPLGSLLKSPEDFGFLRISAQSVLDQPGNREIVNAILPGINLDNVDGDIFVLPEYTDDNTHNLQLTLAVDSILLRESKCPVVEDTGKQRGEAWGSKSVSKWDSGTMVVMKCGYGTLKMLDRKDWCEHSCARSEELEEAERRRCQETGETLKQDRTKGGRYDCGTQEAHEINSPLDLPPEHLCRYWWQRQVYPFCSSK